MFSKAKQEVKYLAVQELHHKHGWSIQWMCKVLKIARSSYYKWTHRVETSNEIENHELCNLILDYDEMFGHILGYRRMTDWINEFNRVQYNPKRIRRLMKKLGVKSVIRQKSKKYSRSTPEITAENILNRNFFASKPNEKWLTDVTEFKIKGSGKKLYLSAIIDLYDLSIVAYHISDRNNNQLVFDTYHKAITRYPEAKPLFHSDRGFQYTSRVFRKQLEDQGMIQSMSRVGHCIDNGPMEGFWGTIKSEMYYPNEFNTKSELKKAIDVYIDFYNNKRLQKRFKNKTPMMVRTEALGSETPISYSIPTNKKIEAYWSNIREKQMQATVA
ncbi:IS3 family transposase [Erysipelothrix inopinata]|uniref:IS3 family transposase n=1 Tax=Erysipelothrix inopinata TaxID=225084 RepID=UPI001FEA62F9|nr:IS3 family transposase [Erysipelothrix inopinata]